MHGTDAAEGGRDQVIVRYWAAARAATGLDQERWPSGRVKDVLAAAAAAHPELTRVLRVASILVDGVAAEAGDQAHPGSVVEVLPPFAGG